VSKEGRTRGQVIVSEKVGSDDGKSEAPIVAMNPLIPFDCLLLGQALCDAAAGIELGGLFGSAF
jgi:hypothetical protein